MREVSPPGGTIEAEVPDNEADDEGRDDGTDATVDAASGEGASTEHTRNLPAPLQRHLYVQTHLISKRHLWVINKNIDIDKHEM